jgi:hypothetical protein
VDETPIECPIRLCFEASPNEIATIHLGMSRQKFPPWPVLRTGDEERSEAVADRWQ